MNMTTPNFLVYLKNLQIPGQLQEKRRENKISTNFDNIDTKFS